jgi:hypothetical protein
VSEQLAFDGEGAFTLERNEVDHRSGTAAEQQEVEKGVYQVQRNEGYMGNYGDFLIRTTTTTTTTNTTTTVDDLELEPPQTSAELFTFRAGRLLISPRIRLAVIDRDRDSL